MPSVAIIGAGDVGGAIASTLATRARVSTIRLIDRAADLAAGKALDIQQAGPVEGFDTRLTASSDPRDAAGASVIVIADPAGAGEDDQLGLVAELARLDRDAPIVCALASHRSLVERAVAERGVPRARIVGSAPLAYVSGVRAIAAAMLDAAPSDVSLLLLGRPPERTVIVWSAATLAGQRLEDAATAAQLSSLRQRIPALWPPGPHALASAAARVTAALLGRSRRQLTCFVALDGELGVRGRAGALPVELGPAGVRRVIIPSMTAQERVALENGLYSH